jgi:hypothetical protein
MKPEIKSRWIERLRSGDYQQGRSYLRCDDPETGKSTFCCLGVLCELALEDGELELLPPTVGDPTQSRRYKSPSHSETCVSVLPEAVQYWARMTRDHDLFQKGLSRDTGIFSVERLSPELKDRALQEANSGGVAASPFRFEGSTSSLTELNDVGVSFATIADIIEELDR